MASRASNNSFAISLVVAVAAVLLAAHHGEAQSSSSPTSGGGSCITEIISLSPCLGYMSGNSSTPKPSCCTALSSVVTSNPRCLCMVLGGGASSLGVTINNTRALELPGTCNVKTPPASQCNSVGVPMPSPAAPATPAVPNVTPAGAGSKAIPTTATTGQYSSGGSIAKVTSVPIVVASAALALLRV